MDPLVKFNHEVSKKDKEDFVNAMAPFSEMESQLSSAPLCLAILGQVNLIATGKDFSLLSDDDHSWTRFKHLVEPRSFRSSLDQVNNEAFKAFHMAHKNMGEIQLLTQRIPGYMQETVKLLLGDSPVAIKSHVPIHLSGIQRIADQCKEKVENVEKQYMLVINTLMELNQASLFKQGKTEEAFEEATKMISVFEDETKQREMMQKRCDEEYEKLQNKLKKEDDAFNMALENSNSLGESAHLAILSLLDTGLHTVVPMMTMAGGASVMAANFSNVESVAASVGTAGVFAANQYFAKSKSNNTPQESNVEVLQSLSPADEELLEIATEVKEEIENVFNIFEGDEKIDWRKLKNDNNIQVLPQKVNRKKESVSDCKESGGNRRIVNKVEQFLNDTEKFLTDLKMQAETEPENVYDLHEALSKLMDKGNKIVDGTRAALNMPIMKKTTPGMMKSLQEKITKGSATPSMTEARIKMAYTKLEMIREQASQTQKLADVSRERQLETNRKLQETLVRLQEFKAQESTQKAVLDVLVEGIKQFAALKTQWSKLLTFFTNMSSLVKVSLGTSIDDFVEHSKALKLDKEMKAEISKRAIDQIYIPSYEAVKIAYLINNLSNVYVELSTNYMMPQVAKLTELLALNCTRDKNEIETKKKQINREAYDMQEKIKEIVVERTTKFKDNVNLRMQEIDTAFNNNFPEISDEQKKTIQEEVKEDIKEAKEDLAYSPADFC